MIRIRRPGAGKAGIDHLYRPTGLGRQLLLQQEGPGQAIVKIDLLGGRGADREDPKTALAPVVDWRPDPIPLGIGRDPLESLNTRHRIANVVDGPVHVRSEGFIVVGIAQQQQRERILGDQKNTNPKPVDPQIPNREHQADRRDCMNCEGNDEQFPGDRVIEGTRANDTGRQCTEYDDPREHFQANIQPVGAILTPGTRRADHDPTLPMGP